MNYEFINIYSDFLKKNLNPQKKLKVIFDCSNGTAGPILKQLTINNEQLTTYFINDKPDGNFPAHGPNPLKSGALKQLQNKVKKYKADLGIIFDADGDRVFFIDNLGRFINPDAIAKLLIWNLKPKKIIIDIRTGWLIKKIKNQKSKIKIIKSRVGHYFIKKLMRKIDADFSAEYSGHYYFKNFFFVDSGILAAIEIINAISKLPYSMADFMDLLPQYYRSPEINFKIKNPEQFIKKIEEKFKIQDSGFKIRVSRLDGLTMEFEEWPASRLGLRSHFGKGGSLGEGLWFNLRSSNPEPLLRLNVETENKKLLDKEIKKLYSLISAFK